MFSNSSTVRKITAALAVIVPCLVFIAEAQAAPARKAHPRSHRSSVQRNISPSQAFARLAARRPDRRLQRHPTTTVRRSHTDTHSSETTRLFRTMCQRSEWTSSGRRRRLNRSTYWPRHRLPSTVTTGSPLNHLGHLRRSVERVIWQLPDSRADLYGRRGSWQMTFMGLVTLR